MSFGRMQNFRRDIASLVLFLVCISANSASIPRGIPAPRAMFVFGDSLVDSGNNNFLSSIAKSNFIPNGIDFPTHQATGRFCNGKIISDLMAEYMGTPPILPILDPNAQGENLLSGANFGSAGAGILDDTGSIFVQRLTMTEQFKLFKKYRTDLAAVVGAENASRLISDGIFSVTIGGNDYVNNYLLPFSAWASQFTTAQFNEFLISTLKKQLQTMYNLGARKVTVSNLGAIGCIPSQLFQKSTNGECIQELNEHAQSFNAALKPMLEDLNQELPGVVFAHVNSYDMLNEYMTNPSSYGLEVTNKACCGQDRSKYVFWDGFHPTETINRMITQRILHGPSSDISPVNVQQMIAMSS